MKRNSLIWILILLSLTLIHQIWLHVRISRSSVHTVNIIPLWENFEMKIESENNYKSEVTRRQKSIDSISLVIQQQSVFTDNSSGAISPEVIALVRRKGQLEELLQQFNQQEVSRLDQAINDRMMHYIQEYCQENSIKVLIAYEIDHPVLYSEGHNDVTEDLTQYINKKYAGE